MEKLGQLEQKAAQDFKAMFFLFIGITRQSPFPSASLARSLIYVYKNNPFEHGRALVAPTAGRANANIFFSGGCSAKLAYGAGKEARGAAWGAVRL